MFDTFVYYLYDSCYPFCSVSREAGHICLFWNSLSIIAYGHAALSLIVVTARDSEMHVHVYCHGYCG